MLRTACLFLLLPACAQVYELPAPAPIADAGNDQLLRYFVPGVLVGLDGRASCDPLGRSIVHYEWWLHDWPSNSFASITSEDGVHATFTADVEGRFVVALAVEAGGLLSPPDEVLIEVRADAEHVIEPSVPDQNRCGEALD